MLAGLGTGTLMSLGLIDNTAKATTASANDADIDIWKYTNIDPQKAADIAYESYAEGSCMFAAVKGLLTTIIDALRVSDPVTATFMRGFPFYMMRYGHGGIGAVGSTCGAFNGCAAMIGMFVRDHSKQDMMIRELCLYYEHTELPIYKPKENKFPTLETTVAESVLCHISSGRWRAAADVRITSPRRSERCKRLTADIVIKTAELLNRFHADAACTFLSLPQPTAVCFDCHGAQGMQADITGTSNCAKCHEHDDAHSNKYLKSE